MLAMTLGGPSRSRSPEDAQDEVSRCMAQLWPLLLAASDAADGPDPTAAASSLRRAADLLRAAAKRIE